MHIVLENGMPVLVNAAEGITLLSCDIRFPKHPERNQIMGPGEAHIRYSNSERDEFIKAVPFKVER